MVLLSGYASAHEWTPTYPKLEHSFLNDVMVTKMSLYNNRKDVEYYEVSVYDKDWTPVEFSIGESNIIRVIYLERKSVDVYISKKDEDRVVYICSHSKSIVNGQTVTFLSSRICSKIKEKVL